MKRIRNQNQKKFIELTLQMLNNEEIKDIITWNEEGTSILILDRNLLSTSVLPQYFKHSNYQSFQRQLNLYGFISSKDQNGMLSYHNKNFTRQLVVKNNIEKKTHTKKSEQTEFIIYKQEQLEIRKQLLCLQIDQEKIKQQLLVSLKLQHETQNNFLKMLKTSLLQKLHQEQTAQYSLFIMKKLVEEMKPGIIERDLLKDLFQNAFQLQTEEDIIKNEFEELNSYFINCSPQPFNLKDLQKNNDGFSI